MSLINKPTVKTRNNGVIAGIDKHVTGGATIGGDEYTPQTLKAVFAEHNVAIDAADALHKQWQDQVNVMRAAAKRANTVYLLLHSFLLGQYGNDANAVLNDFGMKTPKPKGPQTVKTKSAAVAKRAATRAVRHTMGTKQRKALVGTVAGPTKAAADAPLATAPALPAPSVTATPVAPKPANG
jgi:hypothetical protein